MEHKLLWGGKEVEISQELAEALLNSENIRFEMRKAKDQSFADIFGIVDKNLRQSRKLRFVDFQPDADISPGDVLFHPNIGDILTVSKVEPQFYEGKTYAVRAYVLYSPTVIVDPDE